MVVYLIKLAQKNLTSGEAFDGVFIYTFIISALITPFCQLYYVGFMLLPILLMLKTGCQKDPPHATGFIVLLLAAIGLFYYPQMQLDQIRLFSAAFSLEKSAPFYGLC